MKRLKVIKVCKVVNVLNVSGNGWICPKIKMHDGVAALCVAVAVIKGYIQIAE